MAIRHIVTGGFGNGTFNGTVPLVVVRGYGGAISSGHLCGKVNVKPHLAGIVRTVAAMAGKIEVKPQLSGNVRINEC
ncbi:MAG: hypothetical protein KDA63_09325 [Planctomycetales bacterium]|nr:hypothetical protein [Planctomycetales bacterium]